jgi:hypothetical protein
MESDRPASSSANPFVPLYLLGAKPLPKYQPEYYSPGSEDEAVLYLTEKLTVWKTIPDSIGFLARNLARGFVAATQGDEPRNR